MEGSYRGADLAVAQWVADHGKRAGLGSDTLPAAPALYLPLNTGRETLGVLAVLPANPRRVLLPGAAPLARDVRGPDRARARARPARGGSGDRARLGRSGELAQHAARVDLARPAHAARRDGRRRQHARVARRRARRGHARAARPLDRDEGARDVGARVERARPHAARRGRGRAAPRRRASRRSRGRGAAPARGTPRGSSRRGPAAGRSAAGRRRCERSSCRCSAICSTTRRSTRRAGTRVQVAATRRRLVRARDGRRRRARACRPAIPRGCSRSSSAARARRRSSARASGSRSAARSSMRTAARSRRGAGRSGGTRFEFTLPIAERARDAGDASGPRRRGRARTFGTCCACCSRRSTIASSRRTTAERAEIEARSHKPDLLLVDLGLPDGDGLDVIRTRARMVADARHRACRRARSRARRSRRSTRARTTTSPSRSARVSCSRESARRCAAASAAPESRRLLRIGEIDVDLARREAHGPSGEVHLTPLEFRLLEALVRQRGHDRAADAAAARSLGS